MPNAAFATLATIIALTFTTTNATALTVTSAKVDKGAVQLKGKNAAPNAPITWEGQVIGQAKTSGSFAFAAPILPSDCIGTLSDGVETIPVVVALCGPAGPAGPEGPVGPPGPAPDTGEPLSIFASLSASGPNEVVFTVPPGKTFLLTDVVAHSTSGEVEIFDSAGDKRLRLSSNVASCTSCYDYSFRTGVPFPPNDTIAIGRPVNSVTLMGSLLPSP